MTKNSNYKYLIFTAENLGLNTAVNKAVFEAYHNGFLSNSGILSNGKAFNQAILEIVPSCPDLGLGINLNLTLGKTVRTKISRTSALCNSNGEYQQSFTSLLINSTSEVLLKEIESDFRVQLEKILEYTSVDYVASYSHIHAIPPIFKIVCKLAKEYKIKYIRTHNENLYFKNGIFEHLNLWFPTNIKKMTILKLCTKYNQENIRTYNLKTNNYLVGLGYENHMDSKTIDCGLNKINDSSCIAEIIIKPCQYNEDKSIVLAHPHKRARTIELLTTCDRDLFNKIKDSGWTLTNYSRTSRYTNLKK